VTGQFTFGYRIDLERIDELRRSAIDFRTHVDGRFSTPPEIDPRPWHRIENQGAMGSCQGHALSSVCEMGYHIATNEVTQFSPLFAYYATQQIDGLLGRDAGSTISGGMQCAKQFGACPLEAMPYPQPVRYTGRFTPDAFQAAAPFKIRSHALCAGYDDVFAFLASGQGGVEIGLSWGSSMTPNRDGVIEQFRSGGGGHAVCFLGYSRREDSQGRKYLWLANSWSEDWGDRGWAEVSPEAVDQMAEHRDTVMIGLSDLSTPTPRVVDWVKESVFT
jgi:hypothetical protein